MKLAGDHVQVLVNGYDLTGDSNKVTFNDSRSALDMTAFGDAVQRYMVGRRQSVIDHSGYVNPASGRSHPTLKSAELNGVVTVLLGQNAAPVMGDPAYSLVALQSRYSPLPKTGEVVSFTAAYAAAKGTLDGWGTVLAPATTITNTTTGSGLDQGAATTYGGAAYLHLLTAAAADRYSIIVEGADNAGFSSGLTTHATFTLNASAVGSERIAIAGTIKRYVRVKATRISGTAGNTVVFAVNLVRF
jgi:hypothetical protein